MEFQYYVIRWDYHGQQSANCYTWIQFWYVCALLNISIVKHRHP
jgi:hypothetical protein